MLTKKPQDQDHLLQRVLFFDSARSAFQHSLLALFEHTKAKILVPAYVGITEREGSGVMDPILSAGVSFDFYKVDAQLNADVEQIRERVRRADVGAILVVHYFGFPQKDIIAISEIARENGIVLIEDCAHALYSSHENGRLLGSFGEYSFFSLHKSLPTHGGGMLRLNDPNGLIRCESPMRGRICIDDLEIFTRAEPQQIADRRRRNYEDLGLLLAPIKEVKPLFPVLTSGTVPLNFPIVVGDRQREGLYFYLRDRGLITIALYYRLIDQISPTQFPISHDMSQNILNLPIHQDVRLPELEYLADEIRNSFGARSTSSLRSN